MKMRVGLKHLGRKRWAKRLTDVWQRACEETISAWFDLGNDLIKSKEELSGEFGLMFEKGEVPFSWSTANRIMAIAQDERLLRLKHSAHGPNLPPSWRTLYELRRLDDYTFDGAVRSGAINAEMERIDVSKMLAQRRRDLSRAAPILPDGKDYRAGDCRDVLSDVADNSVALVMTDPPYPEESEPLYRWLAEWSARVLIPGGSLICYTGHWSLNRDVKIFDEHLRYWWVLAMLHHQSRRLPGKFVIANFKPVLWYVKDHRRGRSLVPDVLRPPARDKDKHEWGQGEGGVTDLIEHLTEPGELIVDPFAGTGQWGDIAKSVGRRWIGADVVRGGEAKIVSEAAE